MRIRWDSLIAVLVPAALTIATGGAAAPTLIGAVTQIPKVVDFERPDAVAPEPVEQPLKRDDAIVRAVNRLILEQQSLTAAIEACPPRDLGPLPKPARN